MLSLIAGMTCLRAEDWKTTDGKVYQDVKVIHVDADLVTILHHDGGGQISLAKLPPDLQKRFNYDPVKAKLAAEERARADAAEQRRLHAETNSIATPTTAPALPMVSVSQRDVQKPAGRQVTTGPVAESGAPESTLNPGPPDPSHHSVEEATASAQAMRPDLNDPTYHTMGHMVFVIRQQGLGPDKSDPSHHSMDEIH